MSRYGHLVAEFNGTIWAIQLEKLAAIASFLEFKAAGHDVPAEQVREIVAAGRRPTIQQAGAIGVLPLYGTLMPRANLMTEMSGGTSIEQATQTFRSFLADSSIRAVLLAIDSPGGVVSGIEEFAAEIARSPIPVWAHIAGMGASAAYWIAVAAEHIAINPTGMAGSIGAYYAYIDESKALEQQGLAIEFISAGTYKTELSGVGPLTAEARAHVQGQLDYYYGMFARRVAKSRGVSVDAVRQGMGQARVEVAKVALAEKMVDRIATFDETVSALVTRTQRAAPLGQVAEAIPIYIGGDLTRDEVEPVEALEQIEQPEPVAAGLSLESWRERLRLAGA